MAQREFSSPMQTAKPGRTRKSRIRALLRRLRGRPDSEHEMGFNRVLMAVAVFLYVIFNNPAPEGMLALAVYVAATVAAFIHILFDPAARAWRRLLMMAVDFGGLSYFLYVNDIHAAGCWPLYLWTILGNGFRFGNRYLFAGALMAIGFFLSVILTTPFWHDNMALSVGLLVALVIIPAHSSQLIKKLSKAKAEAEEASRAKSYFLASVSHELRTPLTAILGLGAHLRDSDLSPEQRSMAETVVTAGRSLLSLINQLLDFARLGAKGITSESGPFDLLPLLFSVRDMMKVTAEEKGLRIAIHVAPETPLHLEGDEARIRDVLVNLVGNALKFTESGSITISANGEDVANGNQQIRFGVADTGIGIKPEAQQHIFESFRQADHTIIDRFGGTGLGLAISKQLVALLGGDIGVDSVPGEGSCFWFTARVRPIEAGQEAAPQGAEYILVSTDSETIDAMEKAAGEPGIALRAVNNLAEARTLALASVPSAPRAVLIDEHELARQGIEAGEIPERLGPEILPILLRPIGSGLDDIELKRSYISFITPDSGPEKLARALRIASAGIHAATPAEQEPADCRPLRILVADDNVMNQKVFAMILGRAGHQIETAADGEAALDAMKDHSFDIVLMDVNMPVLNGIEATKLYRFTALGRRRIPIVGITADASPATAERCIEAGMDACIAKPVEAAALLRLLAELTSETEAPVAPVFDPTGVVVPLFRGDESQTPAINASKLHELEELGGEEFLADLLNQYVADTESLLTSLSAGVAAADAKAFRDAAHALRSSAGNVGADRLAEICQHLQRIEQREFEAKGGYHLKQLETELARVRAELADGRPTRPTVMHR
jgi:two-component system sensor histidine kinase RpfC